MGVLFEEGVEMAGRRFEKISYEQFCKDVCDDRELYERFELPRRSSRGAAGYDFWLLQDVVLWPGETKTIPTGVKACFASDEVLLLIVRSSTGFKYNIRLVNQVGVIDADYHGNPDNEGHIFARLQNESDEMRKFAAGDRLVQGLIMKYLTTDDDDYMEGERRSEY